MIGKLFYNDDNNFLSFSILVGSRLIQKVAHSKLKCGKQTFYTLYKPRVMPVKRLDKSAIR